MTPTAFRNALIARYGAECPQWLIFNRAAEDLWLAPATVRAMWYGRRRVTARTEKQLAALLSS